MTGIEAAADLLAPCERLPHLAGETGADVLPWAVAAAGQYNRCRAKHKALAESGCFKPR
ncbi:hypothetical protein [Neisseria bergeri]|uniref:hypothetical protein n=1 Tax=Neisseria bergeri TaxID=1906581 RepID=UPI0027DF60DE|nr:hypothetical protein [Neisseria bergeri]